MQEGEGGKDGRFIMMKIVRLDNDTVEAVNCCARNWIELEGVPLLNE
jgi:hypothetical protein